MTYHAFFSHSNIYKDMVEEIAIYIEDKYNLCIWLDKWMLTPGGDWIQEIEKSLTNANSCVIFIGKENSTGWYKNEVELAFNKQSQNRDFRIIPVLLPGASDLSKNKFLSTKTHIDLRYGIMNEEELYRLACGIKGIRPGRYVPKRVDNEDETENSLKRLAELYKKGYVTQKNFEIVQIRILEKGFEL